mmetsp:Transcript_17402/g.30673  ORF Transcript_17402/g.30673 Transcript_17402/m.30673 type:complete len:95 (-) Transcript_17402:1571-1855(-)
MTGLNLHFRALMCRKNDVEEVSPMVKHEYFLSTKTSRSDIVFNNYSDAAFCLLDKHRSKKLCTARQQEDHKHQQNYRAKLYIRSSSTKNCSFSL